MKPASSECLAHGHHTLSGLRDNVSEDILRYLNRSPEDQARGDNFRTRLSAFLTPELLCLFLYRMAHFLHVTGWGRLAAGVTRFNFLLHKVSITPSSCIGPGCRLSHPAGVMFHGRAGRELTLFSLAVCCPQEPSIRHVAETGPCLGDRVTVGAHAVLLGPITVGSDTKIAFSVRLDHDTPPGVLVVCKSLRQVQRPLFAVPVARSA